MTARSFEYAQLQEGRKMGGVAGYGLRRAVIDDQGEIKGMRCSQATALSGSEA